MTETVPSLYAVSDLHVSYPQNRAITDALRPANDGDWLIVAGDVGEKVADIEAVLAGLRARWAKVIWAPGNHELWSHPDDPVRLRGEQRYRRLVEICRGIDVLTPEDEFAVWPGPDHPVTVAPLFLLYDYSWTAPGTTTKEASLKVAYESGVVCTDEMMLHPDPYPDRESWCWARVTETRRRLDALAPETRTALVTHWPLVRQPTEVMYYPEFAQWCGTDRTADWHVRYRADVAVYGHLHIPRTTHYDGVRFEEVSLGYPREWGRRSGPPVLPKLILAGAAA
ncbi:metallophosphoesterase family protein [Actinoplanes couchii]|uniref:Metallophosphoesterase n=1 Tax=Actinoplanes couchii TaxID=403638 RepID=A0ABQ3XEF3_9ACTN|nr:metallophosphoesterase [Actinoplanes couchii]MDR6319717.1 putative phosphodiesterase [Actinoplanes couchii]GID56851.1 metallophosphoesterase [Actinoplanes couchii]